MKASLVVLALMLSSFVSAQTFTVTDMGPNVQFVRGINAAGQVVGDSACPTCFQIHAFIFTKAAGLRLLPDRNSSIICDSSSAKDINKFGDVVGSCQLGDGSRAVLWPHGGGMLDLGWLPLDPGSVIPFGAAFGINDSLQVVGGSNGKAFLWTALAGMKDLGAIPNTRFTAAAGIDADGYVVGNANLIDDFNGTTHPWAWTAASGAQEILSLPPQATVYKIRNGTVVGFDCNIDCESGEGADAFVFGFIWQNHHGATLLGSPTGPVGTAALAVNSLQQVVGSNAAAFLWTGGKFYNLNKLIHAPGWFLIQAQVINDKSQIAGYATLNGVAHGFLLTLKH